jgi:hypothetical protein
MRRRKKGGISGIAKTVPLSVALAALSTGVAFADAPYDHVQGDMGNGHTYEFVLGLLDDAAYAEKVREALSGAFTGGRSILVQVDENKWLEFGENASAGLTLADIVNDGGDTYAENPNPSPDMYTAV